MSTAAFLGGLRDQPTSHVNEVVGDDPQSHPSPHPVGPVVAATRQPVPPLDHADPAFTSRAPFLAPPEPALLLLANVFIIYSLPGGWRGLPFLSRCGYTVASGLCLIWSRSILACRSYLPLSKRDSCHRFPTHSFSSAPPATWPARRSFLPSRTW